MLHLVTPVARWAERSQQRACRNAMVASTAITRARAERTEAQEYVAGTLARRSGPAGRSPADPSALPVQRDAAPGA